MEVDFEVSYSQTMPSILVHFLVLMDQDVELYFLPKHLVCLHATISFHEGIVLIGVYLEEYGPWDCRLEKQLNALRAA